MDDLTNLNEAQVKDIVTNKENPLHAKYASNDPAVRDSVAAAYERLYPGNHDLTAGLVSDDEALMEPLPAKQAASMRTDDGAERQQAEQKLREHWGGNYAENYAIAQEAVGEFVGGPHAEIIQSIASTELGNDPRLMDLLVDIGKKLKGY